MKELHYKRMDMKPKATQEGNLIETNLPMGKSTGFLTFFRKMDPSLLGKLEPIPKSKEGILLQRTLFLKGMEGLGRSRDRRKERRWYRKSCIRLNPTRTGARRQVGF